MVYRQAPAAILGHVIAAGLVVYALYPVVSTPRLFGWYGTLILVGAIRAAVTLTLLTRDPRPVDTIDRWQVPLSALAFGQTLVWGLSVFVIWPETTAYRAFLTAALAGVIAAGGIMLAFHRRSFLIYCLPVAIPCAFALLDSGGRVEVILCGLVVLYSVMLIVAVNRLGRQFVDGIVVRLQMESLSRTDPLTQLSNRRGFDEYFSDVWQNAIRARQPVGLIIADIDRFKAYNDRYGHPQGDVALTRVASVLASVASRTTDLCGRVGGEEFAIILPSTDEQGTRQVAEHIQRSMEEEGIAHEDAPDGHLTINIGYAARVPMRTDTIDAFYEAVDQALYAAKEEGRDRITLAGAGENVTRG